MPIHTKTIGTVGRDYSTLQAWEDDLDDGTNAANNTTGYVAGEDAVGEVYADSTFTGSLVLTGGDVVGLNSVTLTVPVAERHDGTAGTGAKMTAGINIQESGGDEFVVEWIEIDLGGGGGPAINTNSSAFTKVPSIRNMLVHDQSGGSSFVGFAYAAARDCQVLNSIFYDNTRNTSLVVYGLALDSDRPDGGCFNNTVYNVANAGSGDAYGISINTIRRTPECEIISRWVPHRVPVLQKISTLAAPQISRRRIIFPVTIRQTMVVARIIRLVKRLRTNSCPR